MEEPLKKKLFDDFHIRKVIDIYFEKRNNTEINKENGFSSFPPK